MHSDILRQYGFINATPVVTAFGTGLINHTWKVSYMGKDYILQRINDNVFKQPADITSNISLLAAYLKQYHPGYFFVAPVKTIHGDEMFFLKDEGYFRMFPFVAGSHSKDVLKTAEEAFEAASQFGKFTRLLAGINIKQLKISIPDFHNLSLRYRQFLDALKNGNIQRIKETKALSDELAGHAAIVNEYENITGNSNFKLRVTHHDTKISNVLFDEAGKGLCVIDLDTVMPGYFISDVGDMMRTYLSPVSEEEKDFRKINIRDDFYEAIVKGYYRQMKDELTQTEKKYFFYAGTFMIYMQAIRFLTDYLNNDIYYGAKYPGHNLVRAGNQAVLLQRLLEKEKTFSKIIEN
ncbi:MAG: aminoglycoside phosphotransferase family protein [Ferruginibacter sp.]|nr:aminoglycoside phosphotransferase family protein [Bacteroidota bacterium]MBX2919205.1 aminoglycoside phosphotransferase family protein [Ferruginibacter sp.]MCC7378840.1 aminoglycoside phosphotransferase family protein [Chitinophagaceae bacterium]